MWWKTAQLCLLISLSTLTGCAGAIGVAIAVAAMGSGGGGGGGGTPGLPLTFIDDPKPETLTRETSARFFFSSDVPSATFEGMLGSTSLGTIVSPHTLAGLAEGEYTFQVWAVAPSGLQDETPEEYTWKIDLTPPVTTIDEASAPDLVTSLSEATFQFDSPEPVRAFARVDDDPFVETAGTRFSIAGLTEGAHEFQVYAVDLVGWQGPTATWTWAVDLTPPVTTIDEASAPDPVTSQSEATFQFDSPEPVDFFGRVDGNPFVETTGNRFSVEDLTEGTHEFQVYAVDLAGLQGPTATWTWTVDLTLPVTTIDGAFAPDPVTNQTEATFRFDSTEEVDFFARVDDDPFVETAGNVYFVDALTEGAHEFQVYAVDLAGLQGPTATWTWTVDVTPPVTTITSMPENPSEETADPFTFRFSCSEPWSYFVVKLDENPAEEITVDYYDINLTQGGHVFQVHAGDAAGLEGEPDTYRFLVLPAGVYTNLGNNSQGYMEYQHDPTGIILVRLPGGTFNMGSPDSEVGRSPDEGPVHPVTLWPFLIGKYEVTQGQWKTVMGDGNNPSCFLDSDDHPVERVSWVGVQGFETASGSQFTLPTEAQWEYACRAGTGGRFAGNGDLDDMGWYGGNSVDTTHAVGELQPNQFGLYDMHGNVTEWCEDSYDEDFYLSPEALLENPIATSGPQRVLRGGCYSLQEDSCRSAARLHQQPSHGNDCCSGFRVAIPLY